jgi:hypothetical protein
LGKAETAAVLIGVDIHCRKEQDIGILPLSLEEQIPRKRDA